MGYALEEPDAPVTGGKQAKMDGFEVVSADAAQRKATRAKSAAKGAYPCADVFLLSALL
jgi:hypothetical protein